MNPDVRADGLAELFFDDGIIKADDKWIVAKSITMVINMATFEERERCAKIAEAEKRTTGLIFDSEDTVDATCFRIAGRIRKAD